MCACESVRACLEVITLKTGELLCRWPMKTGARYTRQRSQGRKSIGMTNAGGNSGYSMTAQVRSVVNSVCVCVGVRGFEARTEKIDNRVTEGKQIASPTKSRRYLERTHTVSHFRLWLGAGVQEGVLLIRHVVVIGPMIYHP